LKSAHALFLACNSSTVGIPIVDSPQLVLRVGFEAMASPTADVK